MDEVLGFVGRAVGVSLGVGAVSALRGGLRPVLREVIKAGIIVTETVQTVAAGARDVVVGAALEAREVASEARTEAEKSGKAQAKSQPEEPRQIAVVKD